MKLQPFEPFMFSLCVLLLLVLFVFAYFQKRKGSEIKKKLQKELRIKQAAEEYDAKKALTNS